MALRTTSAPQGALVAAICVVLVVSWVGKPAEGSPSSCAVHRCVSECPSKCDEKAASDCKSYQTSDEYRCRVYCGWSCKDDCPQGSACCDSKCASQCKNYQGSNYTGCLYGVSQQCKDKCEKECKGEKVDN